MRQMYLMLFSISTTSNDGSLLTILLRRAKASLVDTSYAQGGEYVSSFLMLAVQMQLFGLPAIGLGHPWIVCDGRVGIGASSGCSFVSGSAPDNEDNVGNSLLLAFTSGANVRSADVRVAVRNAFLLHSVVVCVACCEKEMVEVFFCEYAHTHINEISSVQPSGT